MTRYQIKKRIKELKRLMYNLHVDYQTNALTEAEVKQTLNETAKELAILIASDDYYRRLNQGLIYFTWSCVVSLGLMNTGFTLEQNLILIGLSVAYLSLLLIHTQDLTRAIEPQVLDAWFSSKWGGTYPEWRVYCKKTKFKIGFNLILLGFWLIPFYQLSVASNKWFSILSLGLITLPLISKFFKQPKASWIRPAYEMAKWVSRMDQDPVSNQLKALIIKRHVD